MSNLTVTERALIYRLLEQGFLQEKNTTWQIQGFGMLRLYITPEIRLHVWHNGLVYHNKPSSVHNHPWDFVSRVVVGSLRNVRFKEVEASTQGLMPNHHVAKILCGPGGGIIQDSIRDVFFEVAAVDEYPAGETYRQAAEEFHTTVFQNGTVTLVTRTFKEDQDHAQVAFARGSEWQTAEPRIATQDELALGLKAAIDLF